jgi:hypothetical protein
MRGVLLLACVGLGSIAGVANATVYTQDANLKDFELGTYATFSNFRSSKIASPFTPTNATLEAGTYLLTAKKLAGLSTDRGWLLATFATATDAVRIYPNSDQFGSPTDGYQYTIEGSNNLTSWTALYDTTGVTGSGEPYTIGSHTGTAPTSVNNVRTSTKNHHVAYIADFTFGTAYKYYALGASTVVMTEGDASEPISRVTLVEISGLGDLNSTHLGIHTPVPEPASWAMMLTGIGALGLFARRRRVQAAV